MKIAFVWDQFGEYHVDRCEAVAEAMPDAQVVGIEFAASSLAYAWPPTGPGRAYRKVTLFPDGPFEHTRWPKRLTRLLRAVRDCDAIFLAGYDRPEIFLVALALRALGRRTLIMNDSKFDDKARFAWREWLKGFALAPYAGALLAGQRQVEYFRFLGYTRPVAVGYDTVSYRRLRSYVDPATPPTPADRRPFLFVGRFVSKKNALVLLDAYAAYVQAAGPTARELVMIGDGPMRGRIEDKVAEHRLEGFVRLTGFLESPAIAAALHGAYCLIVPSVEEQWALVVNEALAFGVPIIASTAVGAASVLVRVGVNGLIVEPDNIEGLTFAMALLDRDAALRNRLSLGSSMLSVNGDVSAFVSGVGALLCQHHPRQS